MTQPAARYRQALSSRDLRLMLLAFSADKLGTWAYSVVISAYVYGRTDSPGWVAAVLVTQRVVSMLASGPAGVIADRYDRRRVVQAGALGAAVAAGVVTTLVATHAPLWLLPGTSALVTLAASVNRPASGALVPDVVDERDLAAANALFATVDNVVVVIGPALGGLLLLLGQPTIALGLNSLSYVVSALLFGRLKQASRGDATHGSSAVTQFLAGWRLLTANRLAFVGVLMLASAVFGAMSVVYGPLSTHLGTGANGYSYLIAAQAAGGVIGALLSNRLASRARLAPVLLGAFVVECGPLAFSTVTHSPVFAAGLEVVFGAGLVGINVIGLTALQRDLPREASGRANALLSGLVSGATALASLSATALLTTIGLTPTLIAVGVGFPLLALPIITPMIRTDRAVAGNLAELTSRVALLEALDLFAGASRPVLEQLARSSDRFSRPAGAVLIKQGEAADELWLLESGALSVVVQSPSGDDPRPDVTAPGYVGEIGLLRKVSRTATVEARTDVTGLNIRAADFFAALDTTALSTSMLASLSDRFGS